MNQQYCVHMQVANPRRFLFIVGTLVTVVIIVAVYVLFFQHSRATPPSRSLLGNAAGVTTLPTGGPAVVIAARKVMAGQVRSVITVATPAPAVVQSFDTQHDYAVAVVSTTDKVRVVASAGTAFTDAPAQHCYLISRTPLVTDFSTYWEQFLPQTRSGLAYRVRQTSTGTLITWKSIALNASASTQATSLTAGRSKRLSAASGPVPPGTTARPVSRSVASSGRVVLDRQERIISAETTAGSSISQVYFSYPAQIRQVPLPAKICRQ